MVLARQTAIAFVKSEIARQGLRVHSVAMRDIHIAADDYLRQHPELIPATEERVRNSPDYEHCLNTRSAKQGEKHDECATANDREPNTAAPVA
jgi:hypothetical protein